MRCSKRWAMPVRPSRSWREPTRNQVCTAQSGAEGSRTRMAWRPLSRRKRRAARSPAPNGCSSSFFMSGGLGDLGQLAGDADELVAEAPDGAALGEAHLGVVGGVAEVADGGGEAG